MNHATFFFTIVILLASSVAAEDKALIRLNNDAEYEAALKKVQDEAPAADAPAQDRAYYQMKLASAHNKLRQYNKAEVIAREVLNAFPEWDYPHSALSVYLGKQGKYKEAETEALRAMELNPKDALSTKLVLASWQWHLGKKEAASADINGADEIEPDNPKYRIVQGCLACFYASVGDEEKIARHIGNAIKATPHDTDFFKRDICFDPYRAKPWFIKLVGATIAK